MLRADRGFRVGVFSLNASSGIAMTRAPERWTAAWPKILAAARIADDAGLDFLLPLQRWRGYGGATDPRGACLETFTQAGALAAATQQIAVFATVQVSLTHPAWAARALATLDHVSGGRAGLNIVCGWNPHDFAMFDTKDVGPERRFDQGAEWTQVLKRLLQAPAPFDHRGAYYDLLGAHCSPRPLSTPPMMSAAFSPTGRAFAAEHCDVLFTTVSNPRHGARHVAELKAMAAAHDREIAVFTPVHVVCRATDKEAQDYYRRFSVDLADDGAVDNYIRENAQAGKPALAAAMKLQRQRIAGGFGSLGLVGDPDGVAAQMMALSEAGFAGLSVSFVDFVEELPFFVETVLPILKRAGVRG